MDSVRVITPPTVEPISLDEARAQLRLDGIDNDPLVAALVVAVRMHTEAYLRRSLITQTLEFVSDYFSGWFCLPQSPVLSVTSIKYIDTNEVEQTLAATEYDVDIYSTPARVAVKYGHVWPSVTPGTNRVKVRYVAGYGASSADVPGNIKLGMLLMLGHWFENRQAVTAGVAMNELPLGIKSILDPFVVHA